MVDGLERFALTETKVKGNEEISWCLVSGICVVVPENERAKENELSSSFQGLVTYIWHY